MKRIWMALAIFAGVAAQALPASAALVYTLNCNTVACGTSSNYGTVTLKQLGTGTVVDPYHVEVTVDLSAANNNFAGTGAGYAINWNITGNPDLTTNLIATNATHPLLPGQIYNTSHFDVKNATNPGFNYNASPFGNSWMYAIDYNVSGGRNTNDNKLIFDVAKTGGLLLNNFAATADGFTFAVDIFSGAAGRTFVVASNGDPITVPEPMTWLLFLSGLVGLTLLQRRRKLARA